MREKREAKINAERNNRRATVQTRHSAQRRKSGAPLFLEQGQGLQQVRHRQAGQAEVQNDEPVQRKPRRDQRFQGGAYGRGAPKTSAGL